LNVVLVTIDTLRADRLGCYGYSKIETPNLDRLAKKGVLFENAVTHTPLTAPSHASLFTALYPTVHGVRDTGGFVLQSSHLTLLRKALAEDSNNPTVYYHLGDEYGKAGRAGEAMNLYRQAIDNGLRNAWLYSRLGYLYLKQGNKRGGDRVV
jgi:tetratricopeptide (TPR) repeat protein